MGRTSTVHRTKEKAGKIILESEREGQEQEAKNTEMTPQGASGWASPTDTCLSAHLPSPPLGS